MLKGLPQRFTASDRLKDFATEKSKALIAELSENPEKIFDLLLIEHSNVVKTCTVDGLRIYLANDSIIHLRPSGNAPELRCYVEASNTLLNDQYLEFFTSNLPCNFKY